jgi:hypothetical protein
VTSGAAVSEGAGVIGGVSVAFEMKGGRLQTFKGSFDVALRSILERFVGYAELASKHTVSIVQREADSIQATVRY